MVNFKLARTTTTCCRLTHVHLAGSSTCIDCPAGQYSLSAGAASSSFARSNTC